MSLIDSSGFADRPPFTATYEIGRVEIESLSESLLGPFVDDGNRLMFDQLCRVLKVKLHHSLDISHLKDL